MRGALLLNWPESTSNCPGLVPLYSIVNIDNIDNINIVNIDNISIVNTVSWKLWDTRIFEIQEYFEIPEYLEILVHPRTLSKLWKAPKLSKVSDEEATDEEATVEVATDEDCNILPMTGLNAFVYTGLNAQKL